MNNRQGRGYEYSHNDSPAQLGATFTPGKGDDYYLPIISPLPQKSMPEVPGQIQNNIAQLESNVSPLSTASSGQSPAMDGRQFSQEHSHRQPSGAYNYSQAPFEQDLNRLSLGQPSQRPVSQYAVVEDIPSFSPFPPLNNRPHNVPPTDEERESILDKARETVLTSNEPEMQMSWAQDTLTYVDVAVQNEVRLSETRPGRPRTPRVEHQLRVDAINIVSFLADQHHPKAEFLRGMWLEFGKFGFAMDKKEAFRCYTRAAHNGYARAEYRIGMQFESSNDIEKAIKHYNLGIQANDAASFYRMGMMTLLGQHGQYQDVHRGLDLIKYSAEHADENAPQGAYVYGMLYVRELPQVTIPENLLPFNTDAARYHVEKAAYLGFAKAQVRMGTAYELSQLNCTFDPVLSLHYNNLAARQGEPDAEMAISKWFLSGHEGVFPKSEAMAYNYAQRAAQAGLATAEFAMGYFHEVGIHAPVNLQEAGHWYSKAAEHGNKDASSRIDGISRSKTLSRKDHDRIAVAKINSARGSKLGERPERFRQTETVTMPSFPEANYAPASPVNAGPRYSAYTQNPYPPRRPSPSPYPTHESGPPPSSSPAPMSAPPQAASAYATPSLGVGGTFMPAPNARPHSTVPAASNPYGGAYGQSFSSGPPRPYSGMGSPGPGRQQAFTPGYRTSSGTFPSNQGTPKPNMATSSKPLPLGPDIGFTAPPDLTGPDRKQQRQDPTNSYGGQGRNTPPNRPMPQPSQTYTGAGAGPSHPSPSMRQPLPRNESLPNLPGAASGPKPPAAAPTPPPANLGNNKPAAAPGRKVGKGPATFEEMGVPPSKKEEDCIIM